MGQPPIYSNYPRGGNAWGGYPPGVYFDFIGKAWAEVKQNLGTWIVTTLVAGLLYYGAAFGSLMALNVLNSGSPLGDPSNPNTLNTTPTGIIGQILMNAVLGALQAILITGMVRMALDQLQGREVSFRLFATMPKAVPLVIVGFLGGLMTFVGLLLCVIPGIYLYGVLAFASMYVAFKDQAPVTAITSSMNTLKPYAWSMFGLQLVLVLLMGVSMLCCGIGLLFTVPIAAMTMAMHWNVFEPEGPMPGSYGGPITPQPPTEGPGMSAPPPY